MTEILSISQKRYQKNHNIPPFKEQIVEAPKTDVSRTDPQIKTLRKEFRVIGFREGDNRLSDAEWAFLIGIWERVQG